MAPGSSSGPGECPSIRAASAAAASTRLPPACLGCPSIRAASAAAAFVAKTRVPCPSIRAASAAAAFSCCGRAGVSIDQGRASAAARVAQKGRASVSIDQAASAAAALWAPSPLVHRYGVHRSGRRPLRHQGQTSSGPVVSIDQGCVGRCGSLCCCTAPALCPSIRAASARLCQTTSRYRDSLASIDQAASAAAAIVTAGRHLLHRVSIDQAASAAARRTASCCK